LLHLYPREFRRQYAEDMLAFYRQRVGERAGAAGAAGAASAWLELVPDLVVNALGERFAWLHRDAAPAPAVARLHSTRREDSMSILSQDVRYGARAMMRRPGFTAVVLATLALGIGANTAIFTVVNGVLFRPLPFAHPERTVDFSHDDISVSEPEFVDYRRGMPSLAKLAAYSTPSITIAAPNAEPTRSYAARVSSDFFGVVGTKPVLGRVFLPGEFSPTAQGHVTVIAHRLWVQQFAADPRIVGKPIDINGTPFTIIGVMPSDFDFPEPDASLWTPWRLNPDSLWTRNNHYLRMVGLLADGATVIQAEAQARALNARWMHDFPDFYAPDHPIAAVITPIADHLLGATRPYLLALLGAVGFILLIACVNVANLLLVRGEARRKEFAIRVALGASRGRVLRQMLTESLMYAAAGAALGVGVAWLGTRALIALAPANLPRIHAVSVDARVVAFTTLTTIITGLAFGLAPALRMREGSAQALREGGKTSAHGAARAARRGLVIAEITLAVVVLSGAGLLVRSLLNLRAIDLGFDPRHVITMQVTLPVNAYSDTTAAEMYRQMVHRASVVPGVQRVAADAYLPISGSDNGWSIMIDHVVVPTIAQAPWARPEPVSPDYFRTMGIRIVRGRSFTEQDRIGAPLVSVVNEAMAKQLWPNVNPIGHTLKMFSDRAPWTTIVGVVADVRARGFQQDAPPTMYFPLAQAALSAYSTPRTVTLIARTSGDPTALVSPLRAVVRSLDSQAPVSKVATMDQVVGDSIASRRFTTALLGAFAVLALLLAGIGIYGVISYGVGQRVPEIGVRMAMGATPSAIVRLVLREGAGLTAAGLTLGIAGALLVDRLLRTLLVGVSGTDALTFAIVSAVLGLVAAAACALPARRATTVSPTEALRQG
jgi:putative ABC transport system permease protein